MRVYQKEVLDDMQQHIDNGTATWERQEYGFLKQLDSAGIRIQLYVDKKLDIPMGELHIANYTLDSSYYRIWKAFPPGKYLIKDYRKQVKNKDGLCPYQIVKWTSSDNQRLRAIVRELLEEDRDDIDVTIDGANYKVIKIVDEDEIEEGWLTFEGPVRDIEHIPTLIYNAPTSNEDEEDADETETAAEQKASDVQQEERPKLNTLFE